jgi:checkpoint serine/threonine-protein kinase
MAIFADGESGGESADGGVWQDFGTRDERRKENVVEATAWKGETMPQSAKKMLAPRTPKMEIFKDTVRLKRLLDGDRRG